ncbi:MAG: hypothetical protein K2K19_02910 [Acetatifactor sp.]|nr:hypothetical protein [Acetatifactor sp.]
MNFIKKINFKNLRLPIVFIILLVITIILHQKAFSVDKEALGTEVYVRVVDIKTKSGGLDSGSLLVTVSYQGEEYRLHGVPSSAHFVMKNSMNFRSSISATLYNGKLYYDSTSIYLLTDKLYYAFLVATFLVFCTMVMQMKEKRQDNRNLNGSIRKKANLCLDADDDIK